MFLVVNIFKEKKEKDFRLVIQPSERNDIGLVKTKNYGIISYLAKKDSKKIGEFILWALKESDEIKRIDNKVNLGEFFNLSSYKKIPSKYNFLDFLFNGTEYELNLYTKDGYGYSTFKDNIGNECKYIFKEKPSAEELGSKVMEMFEFKENYDKERSI